MASFFYALSGSKPLCAFTCRKRKYPLVIYIPQSKKSVLQFCNFIATNKVALVHSDLQYVVRIKLIVL